MEGSRRRGREAALQILYLTDMCQLKVGEIPQAVWSEEPLHSRVQAFANHLAEGVTSDIQRINALISRYAENWELRRMATVDRCILRMAAFELLHDLETPVNVVINEALEIAKKYSTAESSKFVNGILDKIKRERDKNG